MQSGDGPSRVASILGAAAEARRLGPRPDIDEPGWTFWELRTLNMHRVVGLHQADRAFPDAGALQAAVRGAIARNFKRAWWRGLAFGVVVEADPGSWAPGDLAPLVDIYENRKGVLQWLIVVDPDGKRAIAMHTWEQVFLSRVYQETLAALQSSGCRVAAAIKGKDGLLKFLTGVSAHEGVDFPEFKDPS